MLSGGDDELAWTRLPTSDAKGAGPSTSAAAADDDLSLSLRLPEVPCIDRSVMIFLDVSCKCPGR
jgi:hypothetical protein